MNHLAPRHAFAETAPAFEALELSEELRRPTQRPRPATSRTAPPGARRPPPPRGSPPPRRPRGTALRALCACPQHGPELVQWLRSALRAGEPTNEPAADSADPAAVDADAAAPAPQELETLELDDSEWEAEVSRSSRDYVRWVQSALNRIISAGLAVDGVSGSMTRSAVRSFQTRQRLASDGIVGPLTEAALVRAGAGNPPGGGGAPAPAPPLSTTPVAPRGSSRFAVAESVITALLPAFTPYTYDFRATYYPWALPGVTLPLAPPHLINCCTFVEALVVGAWAKQHGAAFQWNSARHGQMMITGSDLFSPVTSVIESGMGVALPDGQAPTAWCVAQGWRSSTSGHTFIIVAYHAPSDRVLTLEANQAYSLNGVGCRNFGNLRDLPGGRPPPRWWENPSAPTWQGLRSTYAQGLKLAQLSVQSATWAGLPV
jgi:peptidoglycan hydrolase-like protein with peptidoglycan-binding domain